MLEKYADLIILILGLGLVIAIILIVFLFKAVNLLQSENKLIKRENRKIKSENTIFHTTISRILQVIQSNADEINCLRQQMNQVHQWLGEVLSVSNLIRSEKDGIDSNIVIEELRQRVKWAEEKKAQRIDDDDYYEGI